MKELGGPVSTAPNSSSRQSLCFAGTSNTDSRLFQKSVHPKRIVENFDIFNFTLTPEDISAIDAMDMGTRSGPDPEVVNAKTFSFMIEE